MGDSCVEIIDFLVDVVLGFREIRDSFKYEIIVVLKVNYNLKVCFIILFSKFFYCFEKIIISNLFMLRKLF